MNWREWAVIICGVLQIALAFGYRAIVERRQRMLMNHFTEMAKALRNRANETFEQSRDPNITNEESLRRFHTAANIVCAAHGYIEAARDLEVVLIQGKSIADRVAEMEVELNPMQENPS
jgi:hypothetical protein